MSWINDKERYQGIANSIDPSVKLMTKDGWIWKAIAWCLFIITFGVFKRKRFLEHFATTLGPIQAYPRNWPYLTEGIIVHESRHTRQARWFGFGLHPWIGLPIMALAYLLIPLPLGFAYLRYKLELDADRATWKFWIAQGRTPDEIRKRATRFAQIVASSAYGWAWPKKWVIKGFLEAAERVIVKEDR